MGETHGRRDIKITTPERVEYSRRYSDWERGFPDPDLNVMDISQLGDANRNNGKDGI